MMCAVQEGISAAKTDPEGKTFLLNLMDRLENVCALRHCTCVVWLAQGTFVVADEEVSERRRGPEQ